MPCSDGQEPRNERVVYREDTLKLDRVTRLLCYTLGFLAKKAPKTLANLLKKNDLAAWWSKHQEEDRLREEREKAIARKKLVKMKALSKLSPEEKKALGL